MEVGGQVHLMTTKYGTPEMYMAASGALSLLETISYHCAIGPYSLV